LYSNLRSCEGLKLDLHEQFFCNIPYTTETYVHVFSGARKAWSADEKAAVKRHFSKYYYINELPGKAAIEAAMQIEKALINRTWRNVKDHIRTVRKI
jgi:hypothetical protein